MSHLPPDELIDALESEVEPRVAAHLAECESCRSQVEDLRATLAAVTDSGVPEPAPWFWPRFTTRVIDAASAVPVPRTELGLTWTRALAAAALIVFVVSAAVMWRQRAPIAPREPAPVADTAIQPLPEPAGAAVPDEESPWELVADANADIGWDEVADAGLAPSPGSADRALVQLSERERSELVRLLKIELGGSL